MKQTLMTIAAALLIIGCKKKDETTTTPTTPKAAITVAKNADQTLTANIHYTSNNTDTYQEDVMKLYINDTFANNTTIDPKPANSDFSFTFTSPKYNGTKYTIYLVRGKTVGTAYVKDTIVIQNGN